MGRKTAADDFMAVRLVSDPQVSPDGARVGFVMTRTDREKSKYRSEIWMAASNGGDAKRFTGGDWSDSSPRWSPDGKRILFLSDRQKPVSQLYVIPADGGEAAPLTQLDVEGAISSPRWSPDGKLFAFLHRGTPDGYRKEQTEERGKKELPSPPRVHVKLGYRQDGFGYYEDSFWQVWVADAATGAARQLTDGDWNCGPPVWSPDGATVAFLSDRRPDSDIPPGKTDIWIVPAGGGERDLRRIQSPAGEKDKLAWSPDGAWFAYAGSPNDEEQWGVSNVRLYVMPAAGADAAVDLTGISDMTLGHLTLSDMHEVGSEVVWSPDSRSLLFTVSASGDTRLYRVPAAGGAMVALTQPDGETGGFSISADGETLAVTIGTLMRPADVWAGALDLRHGDVKLKQLTDFNRAWLEEVQIIGPERVAIDNGEGGEIAGWLLRPSTNLGSSGRRSCVLYVHGGPHMQYGNVLFHEMQFLAGQGHVVLYTNPRGSKGYGEAWTKAITGNWGGPDFHDIMAAADFAAALQDVDPQRMAIMGGSYGGYMTAWAVGHTDRFACAITDRLVANLHSMSGTTDFAWLHDTYFKGNAWDDPSELWRCSPLAYAGRINTPLLIIHSDGDLRCDVGQAEELFAALRLQRKSVEFVRYPAETSHGLSRSGPPSLRLDRLNRNAAWLDRWLMNGAKAVDAER